MNFVYFDIETERSADEVGGWHNIEQLGVAIAITVSSLDNEYRVWRSSDAVALGEELRRADCVVGYNSRGFDFRVLQPYLNFNLKDVFNIDLMLDLRQVAGFRPSLDNCCAHTLNEKKSGGGLQSLQWWRDGQHDLVIDYCKKDVDLTRRLHEFGCANGHIKCLTRTGVIKTVTVPWNLACAEPVPLQGSLF